MAGLDTRGAFDGFVQGFGMMQNYKGGQDRKAYREQQQGMQERGMDMREQQLEGQQQDRQKVSDQQYIAQYYARADPLMSDIENPDSMKQLVAMFEDAEAADVFKRNPMASMTHILNPKTIAAAKYAGDLGKGEGVLFSDKTAGAMNDYFSPVVNRMPGRRTRINNVYPGQKEGTMAFDLGVTPIEDDGAEGEEYLAGMTDKRGIEGEDDNIMQVPIEKLIEKVKGAQTIYDALGPEKIAQFQKSLRTMGYLPAELPKYSDVEGPDGSMFQVDQHGKKTVILGRKPTASGSSGAAYAPSSDVKTLQYLKANGMNDQEARDELVRLKRGGTGDSITASDRYKVTFLTNQIKEVDAQLQAFPDKEAEATLMQQRSQLIQAREGLAGQLGLTAPPEQQPQQSQQAQQVGPEIGQVEGGYEFIGGDPASPDSWREM